MSRTKSKRAADQGGLSHDNRPLVFRHLRVGWVGLFVFIGLGIVLETMHGLKLPFYLDLRNTNRRLLWTLAHAHGTLFSLIHLVFAWAVSFYGQMAAIRWASLQLTVGSLMVPLGFFLGGAWLMEGEPGLGVFLVPVGALLLLSSIGVIAFGSLRRLD